MKKVLLTSAASIALLFVVGCGENNAPKKPEMGSVQAYLDANPDVAAEDEVENSDDDEFGSNE